MRSPPRSPGGRPFLLCASLVASTLQAQEWAARFPRDPACDLQWSGGGTTGAGAGLVRLVVVPVVAGTRTMIDHSVVSLIPLDPGTDTTRMRREARSPGHPARFDSLPPGRYALKVMFVGYGRDLDTIALRVGGPDSVVAGSFEGLGYFRNAYNCRPRRFRGPGESACIAQGPSAEFELSYLRAQAGGWGSGPGAIRAFDPRTAHLVSNERTCERGGRAYDSTSPPRRVIVVQAGGLFLVYDPGEPLTAGEWDSHCFFDRHWRPLMCLAS